MDAGVRVADHTGQDIGDITGGKTLPPEMPDDPDLMHRRAIEPQRPQSLRNERLDLDLAACRREGDPIEIVDAEFCS